VCRWVGPDGLEIGGAGAGGTGGGESSRVRAFEGVLSIVGALTSDAGNYTCLVENAAATRRRPVSIVVSGQFHLLDGIGSFSSVDPFVRRPYSRRKRPVMFGGTRTVSFAYNSVLLHFPYPSHAKAKYNL